MPAKKKIHESSSIWLLVRDDMCNQCHIINMKQVQNPTKRKLKAGDSVTFSLSGERGDRMRGPIVILGDKQLCEFTLTVIHENAAKNTLTIPEESEDNIIEKVIEEDNEDDSLNEPPLIISSPGNELDECNSSIQRSTASTIEIYEVQNTTIANADVTTEEPNKEFSSNTNPVRMTDVAVQKRNVDEDHSRISNKRTATVSINAYLNLERRYIKLQKEIDLYRTTWMPRPKDRGTIDWIIQSGKILSGQQDEDDGTFGAGKGERMEEIMEELKMDEKQLERLHGSSITSTCRRIVAALYPPQHRTIQTSKSMSADTYKAIRDYARFVHPASAKIASDGILNAAIGNVFAVHKSKLSRLLTIDAQLDQNENNFRFSNQMS